MKIYIFLVTVLMIFGVFSDAHAGLTEAQIQSIISLLNAFGADQVTINNVNASLRGQTIFVSLQVFDPESCNFARILSVGSRGVDVRCLQQYLNYAGFPISNSGTGSPGYESTYFGEKTKAALMKWQVANEISAVSGMLDANSRQVLLSSPCHYKDRGRCVRNDFSLLSPNGGEKICLGSTVTVRWKAPSDARTVNIILEQGSTRNTIGTFPAGQGQASWKVENVAEGNAYEMVVNSDYRGWLIADMSDGLFATSSC